MDKLDDFKNELDKIDQDHDKLINEMNKIDQDIDDATQGIDNIFSFDINEEIFNSMKGIFSEYGKNIKVLIENTLKPLKDHFDRISKQLEEDFKKIDFDKIKNLNIAIEFRELNIEYGIIIGVLTQEQIEFIIPYKKKNKYALLTKMIYHNICESTFEKEIYSRLKKKKLIHKRIDIIRHAYKAHKKKEYYYSIPLLFSQIEGIIFDYLILKKFPKKIRNKYYLIDENGNKIKDENNNPIILNGLNPKSKGLYYIFLDEIYTEEKWAAMEISKRIFKILSKKRNNIMHGNNIKNYKCKLSNELIVIIYNIINIFDDK